jgi:hypothetical protein
VTKNAHNNESQKAGIRAWFDNLNKGTKTIVAVAGGFVTLVTAIGMLYAAVVWLFPSLQRPPPSLEGGVTLSNLDVGPIVTLGEYLRWPGMPAEVQVSEVSEERRQRLGNIIRFDVELKGFAGERVYLGWSVFDADTGKPVSGLTEQPAWPSNYVEPQHDVSKTEVETWVPFPRNDKGTFLVTIESYAVIEGSKERVASEEVKVSTPDIKRKNGVDREKEGAS